MKKIKVFKSEKCSRSKKMKPVFDALLENSNINIEILSLEDEWQSMFFLLEELEGFPTIRFYKDGKFIKELVGMTTQKEILRIYGGIDE